MQSTLNSKKTDPSDVVEIAPDVVLVAPGDRDPSGPAQDSKGRAPELQVKRSAEPAAGSSVPPVDTKFRAAAVNPVGVKDQRPSLGKRAMRVFRSFLIAMMLAVGSGAVALAWQVYGDSTSHYAETAQHYAEAARQMIANLMPRLLPTTTSSPSPETAAPAESAAPAQADAAPAQASAPSAAAAQPAPPAQATEASTEPAAAPTVVTLPPETAQLLQSMAHDLATVGQDIAQLKAGMEQLKVSQEQMARELAKAREQTLRPRVAIAAPLPRPSVLPTRRPMPTYLPPQGAVPLSRAAPPPAPPLPLQPEARQGLESEDGLVPRPPMPVR